MGEKPALRPERLGRALALRQRLFDQPFYRLIHGEGDLLPGLIIDRFGDVLVVQLNTAGMQALADEITTLVHGAGAATAAEVPSPTPTRRPAMAAAAP